MSSALLPARSALGRRGLDGGSIAGAVVGSVVGALILVLILVPFFLRKRRQWRTQHLGLGDGVEAELGQSQSLGGRLSSTPSPPHFDETKGHSSDAVPVPIPVPGYTTPGSDSGPLNGQLPKSPSSIGNGHLPRPHISRAASDPEKPHLPLDGLPIDQGLPSPISPPLSPAATRLDSTATTATASTTASAANNKVADPSQAYPTPPPEVASPPRTHYPSIGSAHRESTRELSFTDSYGPPSRELTGITASGITAEPESFEQTSTSPTHRHFSQISGSIRSLIHKGHHHRRGSRRSTQDGARSPTGSTLDALSQPEPVQPFLGETDISPNGLAWSYYNDPDLISEPPSTYKQPYNPPTTSPAVQPPLSLVPPAHDPGAAPLSPVSLPDQPVLSGEGVPPPMITRAVVSEPEVISPDSDKTVTPLRTFSSRQTSLLRGPGSLARTDSLPPLQPIVADIGGSFTTSPSGPSGRPMDFMGPTNEVEKSWRVDQEYLKNETPSPPTEPPLVYNYMEPVPEHQHYMIKPGPDPQTEYHSPPDLTLHEPEYSEQDYTLAFNITVQEPEMEHAQMEQNTAPYVQTPYFTPPPSVPSQQNTPETRPFSDFSPSPRSDIDQRSQIDSSPRFFPCDQCHRVFDQVHKLK